MINNYNVIHSKLLDISEKSNIVAEVKLTASLISLHFNFSHFDSAFQDVERLFIGKYEGYRECNTRYHDFGHTLMVLLAMARLMHGASLQEIRFSEKEMNLGLIRALMHDTGYIQAADDFAGDMTNYRDILSCTGVQTMIADMAFQSENVALLGKMLSTADLLGQMADRFYLEKLVLLYNEFKEGGVPGFDSEIDLFRKTVNFYKWTKTRFESEFDNVSRFMIPHFKDRWNIDSNVYEESINNNINYLKFVLKSSQKDIYHSLRRNAVSYQ